MGHPPARLRGRHRRALLVLVTLVLALQVVLAPLAPDLLGRAEAQDRAPTAAELGIRTDIAFGRGASQTGWNLVTITASPPVPIRGRLEVRASNALGTARGDVAIEVAAGATRVSHVLLPPTDGISVALVHDDGTRTRLTDGVDGVAGSVLVAGIGAAPALPAPLNTAGTDRAVTGVPLDPAVLDLAPSALDPLSAVVLSASELAQLTDARRATLERAVLQGLSLVVTVADGDGPLPVLGSPVDTTIVGDLAAAATDDAWPITGADVGGSGDDTVGLWRTRGLGSVAAVRSEVLDAGQASRALWTSLVQVRPDVPDVTVQQQQWGNDVLSALFGGRSDLPGTLPFLLFALAFVVLVGPVNGLVLRRLGRRELAWVTVPAITVLFTVVATVAATAQANTVTPTIRAAWWLDDGGEELTVASVQAPRRGTVDVVLPGRRAAIAGTPWSSTQSVVQTSDTATTVRVSLESLQVASAMAWGDPGIPPPFEVTAEVRDGVLDVEVVNTTDSAFEAVEVRFATERASLGQLEPRGTATTSVDLGDGLPRGQAFRDPWMAQQVGQDEEAGPEAARTLLDWGPLGGAPGTVWVAGATTDDLGLAVPDVGGLLDDRGSFVAVGVTPTHVAGPIVAHEVTRDLLRTWAWAPWRNGPLEIETSGELLVRYRLPGPLADGTLVSTLLEGGDPGRNLNAWQDPWAAECFSVEEFDADGVPVDEPIEERCGDVACPGDRNILACNDLGDSIEACFDDGTCQIATPVRPDRPADGDGSAFEVWDHDDGRWLPYSEAFDDDGRALRTTVVSAVGEVLVRVRSEGTIDLSRRGLEVRT